MQSKKTVYPYIPNSAPETKSEMLQEIGVETIEELFAEIPDDLRFRGRMNLPEPIPDEYSLRRHVESLLNRNANFQDYIGFLGAGCARHFVPALCDEINGRGEFLTAYSADPYADHGKWQAFFEANSMLAELIDMDVVGGPLYDGAQAAATSLRIASRITGRKEVVLPENMNPETRMIMENYFRGVTGPALVVRNVGLDRSTGLVNPDELAGVIGPDTAAVYLESPNYFGMLETGIEALGELSRRAGAEFVVSTDPISLGVLAPPSRLGATITCGDLHPLGLHMQCGGGQGGFIGVPDQMRYVAELKDKMYGLTDTVVEGEYGFGHVLFDRTSFGSREMAKEFTGTATALWLITAGVYLASMGPSGMVEVGGTIMARSRYAADRLGAVNGVRLVFPGPFFKEFVINFDTLGRTVREINQELKKERILGGRDLSVDFPEFGQSMLLCVTEATTKEDLDRLVHALIRITGR